MSTESYSGASVMRPCPKLCGGDIELGNFVVGSRERGTTTYRASGLVLSRIEGFPRRGPVVSLSPEGPGGYPGRRRPSKYWSSWTEDSSWGNYADGSYGYPNGWSGQYYGGSGQHNPRDYARRWLPNGGVVYGDLGHTECCVPEVLSAREAVCYFHAMLRIVREALHDANDALPGGERVVVTVNNSDGHGHSWGGHLNFAVTTECYRNIFERRLHHALFLASYLVSSIIFTGAGKVGSENGRQPVPFSITQRGDFYERLVAPQTTYARPIVNSRDEPLTAYGSGISRVHCIFFDSTLLHGASLLKWGATQLVLAMIEQGVVPTELILEDPLAALNAWNQDPSLEAPAPLIRGSSYSAAELQLAILEHVRDFVDAGCADGIVPDARGILAYWEDTVSKLQSKDWDSLRPRIEWILKRSVLERAIERRGLDWSSPAVKHLDHAFSNLEEDQGLYWGYEHAGAVERIVSDDDIERAVVLPPNNTRAWLRGTILAHPEAGAVDSIDWDRVTYRGQTRFGLWPRSSTCTLMMGNPFQHTRDDCEEIVEGTDSLEELLRALGADDDHGRVDTESSSGLGTDASETGTWTYLLAESSEVLGPATTAATSDGIDTDQSSLEEVRHEATREKT